MACIAAPTKTEYATQASSSTLTTFTVSVATIPPLVTTVDSQTCSGTVLDSGTTTCIDEDVPVVTTIAGGRTSVQVPIIVVYEITQVSPTKTLFASCSSSASSQISSPTSSASSSSSSTSPSASLTLTLITPAPSVIVTQVPSTLANGSVVLDAETYTTSFSPVSVLVPIPTTTSSASQNTPHHSTSKVVIAPIVGGILGGFFGLIGVVFLIWYLWRRRSWLLARSPPPKPTPMSQRSKHSPSYIVEPQQYHYGALSSLKSYGSSPPHSARQRSSMHSPSMNSLGPQSPQSLAGTSSPRLSYSTSPTPQFFPSTTMLPGASQPSLSRPSTSTQLGQSSSRPTTPGYFFPQAPPSAFPSRQTWSGCGSATDDERSSSEGHNSVSPAHTGRRTSLPTDRRGRASSSRKSFSGTIDVSLTTTPSIAMRRRSEDITPQLEELPRSPLFVVNGAVDPSPGSSTVGLG